MKWSRLGFVPTLLAALAVSAACFIPQQAVAVVPPKGGEAVKSKLAAESLLLGVTRAGNRMVAVGEYGNVVLSDDNGKTWRQANRVPTTITLTSVFFINDRKGWAVGHDAWIITTDDGGENWTKQLGGGEEFADAALLSVYFTDERNGFAVGAFNRTISTSDGGKTWVSRDTLMPPREPSKAPEAEDGGLGDVATKPATAENDRFARTGADENHLNSIFRGLDANTLCIAAEGGAVFKSEDAGKTWKKLYTGYIGSFWGGFIAKDGTLYLAGMRGNIWRSTDGGATFSSLDTKGADQSIATGVQLADGSMVFVGLGGQVLYTEDGVNFTLTFRPDRKGLNSLIQESGELFVFGEAGVQKQSLKPVKEEIEEPVSAEAPK
jgi:photosystem II stability/assembly factor-like uncharacterized protein